MAGFIAYIKQLAPIFERRELLNTLIELQDEHDDTITPLITDLREVLTGFKYRGELYRRYESELSKHVNFNQSAVDLLLVSLERLSLNYSVLQQEIKRLFSVHLSVANITYDRANVMRYVETVAFYIRFSRKFLLALLAEETAFLGASTPAGWSRAEREYLVDNLPNFAGLFNAINMDEAALKASFAKVPNAEVNEETYELAVQNLGQARLDPLKLEGFSPQQNPIFSLGKALMEWKAKRFKAAENELYALQLRLQELRELQANGNISPVIQKRIKMYEERIETLDHHIEEIENENRYE